MKDVDQETGEDLNPSANNRIPGNREADLSLRNPERPLDFLGDTTEAVVQDDDEFRNKKKVTRISSPERWELQQMMAANVIDKSELPDFDEETGLLHKEDDDEEDLEIEL